MNVLTKGEVLKMLTYTTLEIRAGGQVKILGRLKYKAELRGEINIKEQYLGVVHTYAVQ